MPRTTRYENPFPGMDPYLEHLHIWPGFHNRLIAYMADDLNARVPDNYRVDIEERTEVAAIYGSESGATPALRIPDVAALESARQPSRIASSSTTAVADAPPENGIAVRVAMPEEMRVTWLYVQKMPDWKIVTIIEVLSPTNKVHGDGRANYIRKREEILADQISLVEIDLLRGWQPMPLENPPASSHYRILVCRGWERPNAVLYPFNVQQAIPKFTLPLQPGEDDPEVDLGPLVNQVHRRARYGQITRYDEPPPGPAFASETQEWVDARLESLRQAT